MNAGTQQKDRCYMKTYLKDFKLTVEFVEESIFDCLRHKWKRKDVSYFIAEYYMKPGENIHTVAKRCRELAEFKETRYLLYEAISNAAVNLYNEIIDRRIVLKPIEYQQRYDDSSGKMRRIGISSIKQQALDYVAVNACKRMFNAKLGFYQCASIPNKGQVFGKKTIERWIRKDYSNSRYYYKCDIKKYYPSINMCLLQKFLRRDAKNEDIIYVLFSLIQSYEKGLCIGSYLSQYLANYYLSYAYHHITEQSYSIRVDKYGVSKRINNIKHVLFYMDDIIIFSSSKKLLERAISDFTTYVYQKLDLKIKNGGRIYNTRKDRIDMMGYVISVTNTIVRKKIFTKIRKLVFGLKSKRLTLGNYTAHRVVSSYGWLKNSDLYLFIERFNVKTILEKAKKEVSINDKNKFYREAERLQLLSA